MNQTPPLPPPSGATCPNCGAAQEARAPYCTNCGASLTAPAKGSLSSASKIIISIALAVGALFFGAVGGCFYFIGGLGNGSTGGPTLTWIAFVAIPLLVALVCIWGIFRVQKK